MNLWDQYHIYPAEYYSPDVEPKRVPNPQGSGKRRGIMRTNPTTCHYCRETFKTEELTKDHVVPRSRGGSNKVSNIVAACEKCNSKKGDQWPTCTCGFCQNAIRLFQNSLTP